MNQFKRGNIYACGTRNPRGHIHLVANRLVFAEWLGQLRILVHTDSADCSHRAELGNDSPSSLRVLQSPTLGLVDRALLDEK